MHPHKPPRCGESRAARTNHLELLAATWRTSAVLGAPIHGNIPPPQGLRGRMAEQGKKPPPPSRSHAAMVRKMQVAVSDDGADDEADDWAESTLQNQRRRRPASSQAARVASKLRRQQQQQQGLPDEFMDLDFMELPSGGDESGSAAKRQRTLFAAELSDLDSELDNGEQAAQGDIDDPSMYICILFCRPRVGVYQCTIQFALAFNTVFRLPHCGAVVVYRWPAADLTFNRLLCLCYCAVRRARACTANKCVHIIAAPALHE